MIRQEPREERIGNTVERGAVLKQKLAANRLTTPLFATESFTRDLEAAFTQMQTRRRAGLAPDHIAL